MWNFIIQYSHLVVTITEDNKVVLKNKNKNKNKGGKGRKTNELLKKREHRDYF